MKLRRSFYTGIASISLLLASLSGCSSSNAVQQSSTASPSASSAAVSTAQPAAEQSNLPSSTGLHVTFLDVGQGDSTLIECDGEYMLIDGGKPDQSSTIYTVLNKRGITHLNYMVATHTDADHVGGLAGALQVATCDQALSNVTEYTSKTFQNFTSQLESHNVPLSVPALGDVYHLGSATFKCIGPVYVDQSMNANNRSLVFRMEYGSTSFLFTGDAEQEEQQLILNDDYNDLKVNVLKADHHGSSNGASAAWINAIQPQITVISCGTGNSYGHPHEETLNLLKTAGSTVYRTDLQGDIEITSDGTTVSASVSKNPDADVWQPGKTKTSAVETVPSVQTPEAQASVEEVTAVVDTNASVQTYVANSNTKKFHLPQCKYVAKIAAKNRVDFSGDRQDLINQGYEPCKVCNP